MAEIIHVAPKEAFALSQQGVLLVDVREADEVAQKRYEVAHYLHPLFPNWPKHMVNYL